MGADSECAIDSGLDAALEGLLSTTGVVGAILATRDGLPLALRLPARQDRDSLAAGAAALGGLAAQVLSRLERGGFELAVFDAEKMRVFVRPLSLGFLLVVGETEANVGLISEDMRRAASDLEASAAALPINSLDELP
jgi:predicted regulator of Ras-like GTPase activity (Roadblock/LC7/MglB family)